MALAVGVEHAGVASAKPPCNVCSNVGSGHPSFTTLEIPRPLIAIIIRLNISRMSHWIESDTEVGDSAIEFEQVKPKAEESEPDVEEPEPERNVQEPQSNVKETAPILRLPDEVLWKIGVCLYDYTPEQYQQPIHGGYKSLHNHSELSKVNHGYDPQQDFFNLCRIKRFNGVFTEFLYRYPKILSSRVNPNQPIGENTTLVNLLKMLFKHPRLARFV
ncbi:hypothetical protein BU23DRAFT_599628 [Bimuria novae-zelandiae CBS 107.79]|uniref:Uncharacterized protein n=1 Tax=Bimuria novae-zelandiae CBS 107.79 TaxID=1447943 RepID=A0A6A5V559_9PLEO|nr:hypothetical protein BU23DRAFT_599628 [Bimuria novae-zelandiae CBS 107.79]